MRMERKVKHLLVITLLFGMILGCGITARAAVSLSTDGTWSQQTFAADGAIYWWTMVVPSDGKVELQYQTFRKYSRFTLYNEDQTTKYFSAMVSGSSDSPKTGTQTLWLQAGTYHLAVEDDLLNGYGGDGIVRAKAVFTSANTTETEPNDSFTQAMLLTANRSVRGILTDKDDRVDFYSFQVTAAGTVTLDFTSYFSSARLDLYSSDFTVVQSRMLASGSETSPKHATWSIELDPGLYYIKVTDDVANADPSGYYDLKWIWETEEVPVTSITLSKSSLSLTAGNTCTLTSSVLPLDASNRALTWTSSNTSVATVSAEGKVTAKGKGTAVITAAAADGSGVKAVCQVSVKAATAKVSGLSADTAKTTRTQIMLSWNPVTDASGYTVSIYNSSTKQYEKYQNTTKTILTITKLSAEKKYLFKVAAYTASTDGATGYRLYYKTSSGSWKQYGSSTTKRSMTVQVQKGTFTVNGGFTCCGTIVGYANSCTISGCYDLTGSSYKLLLERTIILLSADF